ncbi:unnamed protein product [Amoebophrya sp. A120]|nr:unnamed protein product [Amoebophrya sp. A120]|eukprot:GSA120T00000794001.1
MPGFVGSRTLLSTTALLSGSFADAGTTTAAAPSPWEKFESFKRKYNLHFDTQEEDGKRFRIFLENLERANQLAKKSKSKAQFGITKFAHLTPQEFKVKHTGFRKTPGRKPFPKKTFKKRSGSIDWRQVGSLVTPVKNQGQCGSCWAFSATEALETGYWKASGQMKILSPQQTVSCDQQDLACNGGDTTTAYEYMQQTGGVETEADYPYVSGDTGGRGTCKADPSEYAVKLDAVHTVSQDEFGEDDMYSAILSSPISICVDASSWQLYFGGVVDSSTCGTDLDHCVQTVGIKAGEYWIVKNQWAEDWGEEGYIRVKTGENACGIAMEATVVDAEDENRRKKLKDDRTQEVIDTLIGLSEGFGLHMEEKCIDASDAVMDKLEKAVELMEKKTPTAMLEALEMVQEALRTDWPAAAAACEATKDELIKIIAALDILDHPKQFVYHVGQDLVVNGVSIYKDVNEGIAHYKKQEFHDFGFSLGTALSLLIVGEKATTDVYV